MEFLALAGGYVLGLLIASFAFNLRCRRRLAEQEAGAAEARCRLEQALERERAAHDATRHRLSEIEAGAAGAAETRNGAVQRRSEHAHPEASRNRGEDDVARQERAPILLQAGPGIPGATPPATDEGARRSASKTAATAMVAAEAQAEAQGIGALLNDEITRLKAEVGPSRAGPGHTGPATPCSDRRGPQPRSRAKTPAMEPVDDLIRIKGIGPVVRDKLTTMGITSFRQIADFTQADIDRLAGALNSRGRIKRERWVEQAKALAHACPPA
ncbi:MAG: hypothetical protein ACR2PO_10880 [Methyloligellaceae bacterium]